MRKLPLLLLLLAACKPSPPPFTAACKNLGQVMGWGDSQIVVNSCVELFQHYYQERIAKGQGEQYRTYVVCLTTVQTRDEALACPKVLP